jgi:trans-2,3-dihydro-3-hydroxyanthranilate isomerase
MLLFATRAESSADFHLRLVGPQIGVNDDPPIGASVPAFAGYLCAHEHIKQGIYSFTAERGEARTRRSVLSIEMDNSNAEELILRVGGPAVLMTEARLRIADAGVPC